MRALSLALLLSACGASTQYAPSVTAPGELVLSYDGRFELSADGRTIARGLRFSGLAHYTRCVPQAHKQALQAEKHGTRALVFSILGGVLGGLSLSAFAAFASPDDAVRIGVLASGVAVAAGGAAFSAVAYRDKNVANGSAVDAMNFYNDALDSNGGTCDNQRSSAPASEPASLPLHEGQGNGAPKQLD